MICTYSVLLSLKNKRCVFEGEAELMSNRCWCTEQQHLSAFIHFPLDSHSPTMQWGTKTSGACASKNKERKRERETTPCLSHHRSTSFYT